MFGLKRPGVFMDFTFWREVSTISRLEMLHVFYSPLFRSLVILLASLRFTKPPFQTTPLRFYYSERFSAKDNFVRRKKIHWAHHPTVRTRKLPLNMIPFWVFSLLWEPRKTLEGHFRHNKTYLICGVHWKRTVGLRFGFGVMLLVADGGMDDHIYSWPFLLVFYVVCWERGREIIRCDASAIEFGGSSLIHRYL